MRRKIGLLAIIFALVISAYAMLGAAPEQQGGVPPQPFFADYFSGQVFIQRTAAPMGIQMVACIDDCSVFESKPVMLTSGGAYQLLEVNPENRRLRGHVIQFYIVNQYGRIKADEAAVFEGAYNISQLSLNFAEPLPLPPPAPALPAVGDQVIPAIPKIALAAGSVAMLSGIVMLAAARRRAF